MKHKKNIREPTSLNLNYRFDISATYFLWPSYFFLFINTFTPIMRIKNHRARKQHPKRINQNNQTILTGNSA